MLHRRAATKMAHWIYVYCSGIFAQGAKLLTVSTTGLLSVGVICYR